jgi:multisubunit Na+/H+ antiporter MnhC subunit
MPDLTISFTFTPALIATAVVYDLALIALGVSLVRRLRETRPAGNRGAAHLSVR